MSHETEHVGFMIQPIALVKAIYENVRFSLWSYVQRVQSARSEIIFSGTFIERSALSRADPFFVANSYSKNKRTGNG